MPTRDRRRFVRQAIWYFLRQDYPSRELLVVDDGQDAVADLIPPDDRIRYLRFDSSAPLSAKLNHACEQSRGDLIAYWEDDDWIAPSRLRTQVGRLMESGMDISRPAEVLHYWVVKGQAWLYRNQGDRHFPMPCGPVLYRRSLWQERQFENSNGAAVSSFSAATLRERTHVESDSAYYVKLIHGGNTSARNLRDNCWQQRPLSEVAGRLASDVDFYARLRNPEADRHAPASPRVTFAAPFMAYDGYGGVSEYIALGMARAGALVDIVPFKLDPDGLTPELLRAVAQSVPDANSPALCFTWPLGDISRFHKAPDLFLYTMWETSQLPAGWEAIINQTQAVFVPSKFVAEVFRECGVQPPIEVVPLGVDPAVYHYEERPEREGLTTLMVGTFVPRKNFEVGIEAWKKAFAADPAARLIIKTRFRVTPYRPDDPRIIFVDSEETTHGIAHWYRQADVLLALGNEGFGLPLVEGMATGLPVVALDSEGQSDVCREAGDRLLSVPPERWVKFNQHPFGECGVRAVPSVEDVAERLRRLDAHRSEARAIGRAASEWAVMHRNVWDTGPQLLDLMEHMAHPPRPLRRCCTLWTPAAKTHSAVSEYAASVAREIKSVRACDGEPDLRGVSLLHVQHEFGAGSEIELASTLRACRGQHVPTVVTLHTVESDPADSEHYADVLAATSRRDEQRLRRRHPHKQVAYLPHGCPNWFPPRKRERGRVIGLFAMPHVAEGFQVPARLLPKRAGADLLTFGRAESPEARRSLEEAARSLPARLVPGHFPSAEVAARLAAEADILVYWDDGTGYKNASAAVRAGLATGVPVLTSRAQTFDDVREAVYQPDDLTEGVARLLEDTDLRAQVTEAAREFCFTHSWARVAAAHEALWESLMGQRSHRP
jgi:glycosyltransferase involved in cell wall biosynthesis